MVCGQSKRRANYFSLDTVLFKPICAWWRHHFRPTVKGFVYDGHPPTSYHSILCSKASFTLSYASTCAASNFGCSGNHFQIDMIGQRTSSFAKGHQDNRSVFDAGKVLLLICVCVCVWWVLQNQEAVDLCQGKWLRAVEQHRKQELAYIENSRHLGTYASLALLSLNTIMFAANFLVLGEYLAPCAVGPIYTKLVSSWYIRH